MKKGKNRVRMQIKNIKRHYCGKVDHMKKLFRKRLDDKKTNQLRSQHKAHVEEHTKEDLMFYAFMPKRQAYYPRPFSWYIEISTS